MTGDNLKPPPAPVFNLPPRRPPAPPEPQSRHVLPDLPRLAPEDEPTLAAPPAFDTPSPLNLAAHTPQGVLLRARGIQRALTDTIGRRPDSRLYPSWQVWDQRLARLALEAEGRPQVAIALVGGTGAGKSTLVNALLEERLLPVSNMRACTAAISEVAFAEDGRYTAEVEFVPRASWEAEIGALLEDLRDAQQAEGDGGDPDDPAATQSAIPQAARDKLRAVYGAPGGEGGEGSEARDWLWHALDLRQLRDREPPEIAAALDAGAETIAAETIEEFRKVLDLYLNGKNRYWPIVKRVRIRGPFAALRGGVTLIDLPGINDPNEAREEVTKRYLKECRYVWIVFNIKRALTKDLLSLMQSHDFLRQIVLDGREDALTLVGTASDDVDPEAGRAEFGLEEEADEAQVIAARNREVRKVVGEQLVELAGRLAAAAQETARADELARALQASDVFTVSAREYLRLKGVSRTRNAVLDTPEATELPALRAHMVQISAGYGLEAQARAHHRQLDLLLAEVDRATQVQSRALQQLGERTEQERKEAEAAVYAATSFLDGRLANETDRFRQALEAGQDVLGERMKLAVQRAQYGLDQTTGRWGAMHWATIRAVARRDGIYAGATGRHDFARDISNPILDAITFAWAEFFGDRLGRTLEEGTERLLKTSEEYGRDLVGRLAQLDARRAGGADDGAALERLLETTEKVLREQVHQSKAEMRRKIDEVRRTLYEEIPRQVQANMRRAFTKASEERGSGMKRRMVDTLATHARSVSATMFADVEEKIAEGVRGLNDTLARGYGGMAATVRSHADLGSRHLTADIGQLSQATIAREQEMLDEVTVAIQQLSQPDVVA